MTINNGLFTSNTDMWETPQFVFDMLNKEFGFTLDVCAINENSKCILYYSPESNSLSRPWFGVCWMNPPYGKERRCHEKTSLGAYNHFQFKEDDCWYSPFRE
jgi:phage N-6-adenine-methyltransferase